MFCADSCCIWPDDAIDQLYVKFFQIEGNGKKISSKRAKQLCHQLNFLIVHICGRLLQKNKKERNKQPKYILPQINNKNVYTSIRFEKKPKRLRYLIQETRFVWYNKLDGSK